ncbi:GNAT family N-acetyltransferase [Thalassobacillus hwangdonensis]|uniref:GNAT family N-acetyltransferase n=1 Tax=Thalassobacillus hwangdonensis TaxID=546108 RepID=A0ABW3L3C5_9BACI
MKIIVHEDPVAFLRKVEPMLLEEEALNNLPLGIVGRMRDSAGGAHLLTVEDEGEVVFMAMQTPNHNWILPAGNGNAEAVERLADYIHEHSFEVPGVIGDEASAGLFATKWNKLSGQEPQLHMNQLIYKLTALKSPLKAPGFLRVAAPADKALIINWLDLFGVETGEISIRENADEMAERMIDQQTMHLWVVKGEPVSMVNQSRSTKHGATINAVYTPDKHKRKGYASNAVHALTEKLLNQGYAFCSLYTDAANPTSNSIYSKIGYEPIGKSIVYRF